MDDLTNILNSLYENNQYFNSLDKFNVLEIGTGEGANSTKILYKYFINKKKPFQLVSYEGMPDLYQRANNLWNDITNVSIINEYFTNKQDITDLLIPNLPDYITDYKETNQRLKNKYLKVMNENNNYFTTLNMQPDIIFIDSSRFMHLPIINLCYQISKNNPNTIIIMEEDYYVDNNYGELQIIENNFELTNVVKYKKGSWQWPFVSFNIVGKK
tara:strand:- start:11607 stop:12248 length:642 start_codon:yes stop_codon:yes gene_type:complete